jgi:6-phosphogluconolactonase (cycloisomerase 2 family)
MKRMKIGGVVKVLLACALFLTTFGWAGGAAFAASEPVGAVYALTNAAAGNAVAVFERAADGTLTADGTVSTQGLGTGAGLGSQGALALSEDGHWLFAVNAGSNDISVLRIDQGGLTFVSRTGGGGVRPISLTVNHDLLYVLNAGSSNISGFRIGGEGQLAPLAGSTQPLSGANAGPAQVSFAPSGRTLVVTEKNTNLIDTYTVGQDGVAHGPAIYPSAGATPFGFAFAGRDHLIVSDAFGGAVNGGAMSSYTLSKQGDLETVSGVAYTQQTAPCWVATTGNGRYAYTANAGSGTISGYSVDEDGHLSLLNADGRTGVLAAASHPIDLGFSHNSRYLYALTTGTPLGISGFRVAADGSLTALPSVGGVPASAAGLVAW